MDKYYYKVFAYDKIVNAPVKTYDFVYLAKGNSYSYTITDNKAIKDSYEKSMKCTVTTEVSIEANTGINIEGIKAESKVSEKISGSQEVGINYSHSVEQGTSISKQHNINAQSFDSYWKLETRANFNVYKFYVYEIQYEKETIASGTYWFNKKWRRYNYSISSYKLVENAYLFSYIDGSETTGFYQYIPTSDGKYAYAGNKVDELLYID